MLLTTDVCTCLSCLDIKWHDIMQYVAEFFKVPEVSDDIFDM